jgi:2,4-dienoyl-CoA reductase-like NADH-dependent reductase (Old Yellow Enzyme family)
MLKTYDYICANPPSFFPRAPGLYNKEQLEGWKLVTDRVHGKGGLMFCQMFHPGEVDRLGWNLGFRIQRSGLRV